MAKLLIFALFFYVLYRLLTGAMRKKTVRHASGRQETSHLPAHDLLVKDPVCHIYIPKSQAIVLQDTETPVYFCSEECRKIYRDGQANNRQENG
jgi:YHS domain-containing protein